jgi:hypothetical protein
VAVSCTPGKTALLESLTEPLISAVACAQRLAQVRKEISDIDPMETIKLFICPPFVSAPCFSNVIGR